MRTTFTIDVKADLDEEQISLVETVLKNAAKGMFAQLVMISRKKPPVMSIRVENVMIGSRVIEDHEAVTEF